MTDYMQKTTRNIVTFKGLNLQATGAVSHVRTGSTSEVYDTRMARLLYPRQQTIRANGRTGCYVPTRDM